MSISEYTSPSSASSSREHSEALTSSRSSFLELFGFRKRTTARSVTSLEEQTKYATKKRKRRVSDDESSGIYANIDNSNHRQRQLRRSPRPVSYYPLEDSDDSDHPRTNLKAKSILNVHNNYDHTESLLRVDRETKLRHEKRNLQMEIEELKIRNQRLVEQLRDKSAQFSKLQFHAHQLDEHVEDRLRHFQHLVQSAKLDAVNVQQKMMNNLTSERSTHKACLERLEELQRENFTLMRSRYLDSDCNDILWQRKIDTLPSYETLYGFTQHVVKKYTDLKWLLLDRDRELNQAELDLIAAQSSLLVTHAQVKRGMNFFLPFKLQGTRIENSRRIISKKAIDHEKDLEGEFHSMFSKGRDVLFPAPSDVQPTTASNRIEHMKKEMSSNKNRKTPVQSVNLQTRRSSNRPMSLVEVEEQRCAQYSEEIKKNIVGHRQSKTETQNAENGRERALDAGCFPTSSLQDILYRSPMNTPVMSRRFSDKFSLTTYNEPEEIPKLNRNRRLDRGYSVDTHERTASDIRRKDELKVDNLQGNSGEVNDRRPSKIQRSQPVHLTRLKPPSQSAQRRAKMIAPRTTEYRISERMAAVEVLDLTSPACIREPSSCPSANGLTKPDKKSWFDKFRNMKRSQAR
ncbi:hypothetical protein DICVIV_11773 [Dictyocaulus viviparus]|uniref:Uncharacterized protein n=1 Tax=Dictyocaulus viviparus TaxID=29172 RepID=A0A0D8XET1_DICVI|nr:hypothetical protein DICVIV_11773 [Dictyocaulus viviparus]